MAKPVFHDPSGRRGRWTRSSIVLLLLVVFGAAAVFAMTIVDVPIPGPLPVRMGQARLHAIAEQLGIVKRRPPRKALYGGPWLPSGPAKGAHLGRPTISAFYVPDDEASGGSLRDHIGEIDQVIPALVTVTGPNHDFRIVNDPVFEKIMANAPRKPQMLPLVQNVSDQAWDPVGTAALLHDPAARARLISQVIAMLATRQAPGVVFDFEELTPAAQPDYKRFLIEAHRAFAPRHLSVGLTVPVGDDTWNLAEYARVADKIYLMLYDEHWSTGDPGPVASQTWFVQHLVNAVRLIGPDKAVAAIANYGYDWAKGQETQALAIEEAWLSAHDSDAQIRFDPVSGNETFDYDDEGGLTHHVWMADAATAWNQLRAVRLLEAFRAWRCGGSAARIQASGPTSPISAPTSPCPTSRSLRSSTNTDVQGSGEILRIAATPTDGSRAIVADDKALIRNEIYKVLPTPYVVQRTGYRPGYRRPDLRRRARFRLDAADPRHPEAEGCARHLLRHRRECAAAIRACSTASSPKAMRSATTATPTPTWR